MAYLPLSTANLPSPVIDPAQGASPADHFNTVIYTGNSLNPASVTGVGFQPDFVWAKTRSFGNTNHRLQDAVRGSNKRLMSDLTSAEIDTAGGIQSFDADGFTVGDGTSKDGFIHFGGRTFVAWCWKANGSGVSNTDGSITSTVSANTTSGFSIVSYTGASTNSTVGHGLNSAPEMIIIKSRDEGTTDYTGQWDVYHKDARLDSDQGYLVLNSTAAQENAPTNVFNAEPTSSVFSIGNAGAVNQSPDSYIAYCFHSVEGFSKFGSYVGNDSAVDGTFVYTGFRPALVICKSTSASAAWNILDNKRSGYNPDNDILQANTSGTENTNNFADFLSNGFKFYTTSGGLNASASSPYIYMAFAENPFKYSNAR